jgi:hypothetical protein
MQVAVEEVRIVLDLLWVDLAEEEMDQTVFQMVVMELVELVVVAVVTVGVWLAATAAVVWS